ncbi:MAG: 30S ribosomal protein S27ae [Candidatus Altiarchaeota archaeon]
MAKPKEKTGKNTSKKWKLYKVGDKLERTRKSCPKCGEGVFLAKHTDRESCGKCGYTEFQKKDHKKE